MTMWMVRAGRNGEQEELAITEGVAVIGWNQVPDLNEIGSREELKALYAELDPSQTVSQISNKASQIWAFGKRIEQGDLIALPLKGRGTVAFGEVIAPYQHRTDLPDGTKHTRPVRWIRTDVPKTSLDQDILDSLGSLLTVCRIKRNNSENRIRALLGEGASPYPGGTTGGVDESDETSDTAARLDIEEYARDEIRVFIGRRFREHKLAHLVNELLKVQGYQTEISMPGPDGGVDIIAGGGALGFDPPRLCVQVKSGDGAADVKVVRELQGAVDNFGADYGLFVSWGGFKPTVLKEFRGRYFRMRLWDGAELVERLLENYDRLPDDVQAELPLKRVWTLVPEE